MKNTSFNKKRRQRTPSRESFDSNPSDGTFTQNLTVRKCSSRSFLNKYEKQIMQRGHSSDKRQPHKRKTEGATKEYLQSRRSRTRTKTPNLIKLPAESDSSFHYAPPTPKPSVENIPKATHFTHSSQDERRYKDSDEEPKYSREYYRNIDDNLNYNRFNPNHNIHKNITKKQPSLVRSREASNNKLSLREYNKILNNESQNSYGYFHGDKNNKLCYISNRPVYYDNSSISETMRYQQQHNELSIKNNSEFRMISKSDASIAKPSNLRQTHRSDVKNESIGKVEKYLATLERSSKKSHHNEKSILDINTNVTKDELPISSKNSEITRLTNEIAKKLQNIGLNIHSMSEPSPQVKSNRKNDENYVETSAKISKTKNETSKDSCEVVERDVDAPNSCLRGDEPDVITGVKNSSNSQMTQKGPKLKHHSKYYLSNPEITNDNCLCHEAIAKQNDRNGCCYREGEHVNMKPDHINLKEELLNCCNPRANGQNIYENLDVCDVQHVYKQSEELQADLTAHNVAKLPTCSCAFNEIKCQCSPDLLTKYGLYNNNNTTKRSRSPLTAVNKKTNGVYVFVPLPENSNDPVEMSKHLQNIYNNIIPLNDKQGLKSTRKSSAKLEETSCSQKASELKGTASKDSSKTKNQSKSETPEMDNETAKARLINQLLDEYNLSFMKQLIQNKSSLTSALNPDEIADELKKLRKQSVSRRHSDLTLNLDQMGKSSLKPKKCPSESSFVMRYTGKKENDKYGYYSDGRFGISNEHSAFHQLQNPMFLDQNKEPLNNYHSINMPFQEFVSDLSKYRPAPHGTGQALFYTRNKSPKSYHGQLPPPPPSAFDTIKPGQPLASSIMDPTIPFQSKANAEAAREGSVIYSRPKSPSQTFNYGLDSAMKKHHQQLINHAHHQSRTKTPFDQTPESLIYGKVQKRPSYYQPGEFTYGTQPHTHAGLYDIQESVEYVPARYDYSPTRYSMYGHAGYSHPHKSLKSQYHKSLTEPIDHRFDYSTPQTCHNHSSHPRYQMDEPYHGDRSQFVDFHDRVHFIESENQPRSPSILKKLQDVVVKPFSLLFKVEPANPMQNRSHLKGILKPTPDVEDDESYDYYYDKKCGESGHEKSKSRNTSTYDDDMDLDSISQPPIEYVTVVDPFQSDSFESLHDEEKRYVDTASTSRNGKTGHKS